MSAYDLVVIGSGPAGQRAAIAAAKLGRKVAVVERHPDVGGGCIHRGTIPSKTLREVVAYLSGIRQRHIYGVAHRVKERITIADLTFRTQRVIENEVNVVRDQLLRNYVEIVPGTGRFGSDPRHVVVTGEDVTRTLTADRVLIATGTRPGDPPASSSTTGSLAPLVNRGRRGARRPGGRRGACTARSRSEGPRVSRRRRDGPRRRPGSDRRRAPWTAGGR